MKNYLLLLINVVVVFCHAKEKTDTIFNKFDTLIQKTYFYKNGKIERRTQWKTNHKFHGEQKTFYPSGKIESISNFNNDCQIDSAVGYYENGKIEYFGKYLDCKENGKSYELSEKGDTFGIFFYDKGKPVGTHWKKYNSGKFIYIINYNTSGHKHGLSQHWREDGTKKDSIIYRNDSLVVEYQYFLNGKLRHYAKYDLHENLDTLLCYHPDGGRTMGEVIKGNGSVFHFSEDGKEAFLFKYENGKLAGMIPADSLKKSNKK